MVFHYNHSFVFADKTCEIQGAKADLLNAFVLKAEFKANLLDKLALKAEFKGRKQKQKRLKLDKHIPD